MAQHDLNIANQSFPSFRTDLNNALSAINSNHSGSTTPSGAVAGTIWLDTTNATIPLLKYYDGVDNITLATINHSTNTVDFNDSTISTPLAVTGNATAGAEIRLPEDTDNGTNFVALKAPDSIASNLTLTLPSADGTVGQVLTTSGAGVLSFTSPSAGIAFQSSIKTANFNAVAGEGYFCNTTSGAFTVTLPSGTPTLGNQIALVDYAGTFDTNNITLGANSNKINGVVSNKTLTTNREAVNLVYVDATQGWVSSSGANEGTQSIDPLVYTASYLIIAGGGSGGANSGGGGGAGGYLTSTTTIITDTTYTMTVGGGGAGLVTNAQGNTGSNSSMTGITTALGGGGGGGGGNTSNGISGGSGGGGGGTGTVGQGNNGGTGSTFGGGGGGAGAVGGNGGGSVNSGGTGGNGLASSITGSSVTRAGGGAGNEQGAGGSGGGGSSTSAGSPAAGNGTTNTGSGGGANNGPSGSGAGGSGVIILSVPTANYSSTTTGSPTVTTSGSNTIIQFNGSGSYTG